MMHAWMYHLVETKSIEQCIYESNAATLCRILNPILINLRNLCWYINRIYTDLLSNSSKDLKLRDSISKGKYLIYGKDYLDTINTEPKIINKFTEFPTDRIRELDSMIISILISYNKSKKELKIELSKQSSKYNKFMNHSNYLPFTNFTEDIRVKIYQLVTIINGIYKELGYEEPFRMITAHQAKLADRISD